MVIAGALLGSPLAVFAQESSPGLLPTNPFYFLKNWSRGVQSLLVRSPLRRAELALGVVNTKEEELRSVVRIIPESDEAVSRAAANYQGGVREALAKVRVVIASGPAGGGAEPLILKTAEVAARHIAAFNDFLVLVRRPGGARALRDALSAARELFAVATARGPANEALKGRLTEVLAGVTGEFASMRRAELADALAEEIGGGNTSLARMLLIFRDNELARFVGESRTLTETMFLERGARLLSEVTNAPRRLRLLDVSRELAKGEERQRITLLRQELARQAKEEKTLNETTAEDSLQKAEASIAQWSDSAPQAIFESIERARFHLREAYALSSAGEMIGAFDQASLARLAAEEAIVRAGLTRDELFQMLNELRSRHDALAADEISLAEIEKKIVALSSRLAKGGDFVPIFEGISEVQMMVAAAEATSHSDAPTEASGGRSSARSVGASH